MLKLNDLPDYPAIRKLAAALWHMEAHQHGAAILVGAGFSRSAARHVDGVKRLPLWNEFSKKLADELNPVDKDLSFSDPLRLAEEYRAYFGQTALNDQIRYQIEDEAWRPGGLYENLLVLPWAEVMTTNWDTLLERAAKDIHNPYYTAVSKPADLAWASSPRIVKLHGTIGVTDTFVAAQEDYRKYPQEFAPFVNFARQVFIENELCLLGFSGDDPNFLQWAGWVRDHLADHARKIYLVGALHLSAARRKHLESINIAPIDLWAAVQDIDDHDLRHQKATALFLQALREENTTKPHQWAPASLHRQKVADEDHTRMHQDHAYAASLLRGQLAELKKDREAYPGWLVCPPALQWRLQHQLNDPYPSVGNMAALELDDRAKLLYEIAWRYNLTFEYIAPWMAEELFKVANPDTPCVIGKRRQLEISLVLLKNSRWLEADDESGKQAIQEHTQALNAILEKHAQYLPDCAAELAYHQALVARDALNYADMEAAVEKIVGEDSVWKLRQAALLMELGRFDEGRVLIAKAYGELRENHRCDRNSIPVLSRLAWAHWLLRAVTQYQSGKTLEPLPVSHKDWQCDPWTWIEDIRVKATEQQERYLKSQNSIEPLFEQGHYRDNSGNRFFSNQVPNFLLLEGLARSVGIPLYSMNVDLLASTAEKLVLASGIGVELSDSTFAIRAAHSESSASIKEVFTRIGVARASQATVDELAGRLLSGIAYWREKRVHGTGEQESHAISALRVLLEVLARLAVRVSSDKAIDIFRLAVSMGRQRDFQHHWLSEALGHLLDYSLESIPSSAHGILLADALAFPLPGEIGDRNFPRWPNPVIEVHDARETYPAIETRVGELVDAVSPSKSATSTAALLRLFPLVKSGFLNKAECARLAEQIWGREPAYQVLPGVDVFPHALLLLPSSNSKAVRTLVERHLYEHGEQVLTDTQQDLRSWPSPELDRAIMIYAGMSSAAANQSTRLLPSAEQAESLFDRLIVWRPWEMRDDAFDFGRSQRVRLAESIGSALSYAIAPALSKDANNTERFEKLFSLYEDVEDVVSVIPAFVYFFHISADVASKVEKIIRKALQGRDTKTVSYAAIALVKWVELTGPTENTQISSLISRMVAIIESGRTIGLPQLLSASRELLSHQRVTAEQVAMLVEAIPNTFDAADYTNIVPNSREAISASSIRAACVTLARTIMAEGTEKSYFELQRMIDSARNDPLPEVRFAVHA